MTVSLSSNKVKTKQRTYNYLSRYQSIDALFSGKKEDIALINSVYVFAATDKKIKTVTQIKQEKL